MNIGDIEDLESLAREFVRAAQFRVYELSVEITRDLSNLRSIVEYDINPLLERHGASPLDPVKSIPSWGEGEE